MILFVEQDKFTISPTIIKSVCMCTFGTFLFDLASNSYTASHIVDFVKIEIEILPGFEKSGHNRMLLSCLNQIWLILLMV